MVYELVSKNGADTREWGHITCASQSPVLDVIALGTAAGYIYLHNIKTDTALFSFAAAAEGAVTSLGFREDGVNTLASGTPHGHGMYILLR